MKLIKHFKTLYYKYSRLLPWASLIWGVFSSFLLTRDYSKATKLGVFTFIFFLLIIVMSTWYSYITKISSKNSEDLKKFHRSIHKRKNLLEFIGLTVTQYFIQYIFMFCIPFLYFKREWIWLFFLVLFIGITLWDPFWTRLFKIQFFRLFLRLIASCMAFSFLYAVLFPQYLDYYYIWFSFMCFFVVFPWHLFFMSRTIKVHEILVSCLLVFSIVAHSVIPSDYQFPMISIWMENSKFSFEKPKSDSFNVIKENIISRKELIKNLNAGVQICAISPIVAPLGVYSKVYQEWYVDGKFIEKIILPNISGSQEIEKYNTFSCKKYLPNINSAKLITTKTFLKNGIYVGMQSLAISN